jgi:hypothetical protein
MKQGSAGSMIRRGVDSTNGGICVRQSPKEGLEVRSFRMVERPSDLGASVGVSQEPAVRQRQPLLLIPSYDGGFPRTGRTDKEG